ncbi:DUF1295 domain-containing protein [Streptomyces sioyaensis]|uniref:DUF1295 domain-containing protein n=1 Tax=Streptomyces sioyaensis TaxID=67364 RepID=UPI0037D5E2EE
MTGLPWAALAVNCTAAAGAAFAVLLVTFAAARARGPHRLADVAWDAAFAVVALVSWALSAGHGDDGRRLVATDFGDLLVWWGRFVLACGTWQAAAAAVVAPLAMSYLLTLGSGKRLLGNQLAGRPGYAAYRARTSGFFPLRARRHPDPEDLRP